MDLTEVSVGVPKRKGKKRVGRGIGSGHGKTAGRGHKGQYASAGARFQGRFFVGGQTPIHRRMPKRGFSHATWDKVYAVVNLADIDAKFQDGDTVGPAELKRSRLATGAWDGVRILGTGELTKKITIRAHHVSKTAAEKIQARGGKVELIAPPKKPVKNKMKPRPPKPVKS
jgi:large subunit ribosomal protein L15